MAEPVTAAPGAPVTPKPTNGANGPQVPAEQPKPGAVEAKPKDGNASLFAALAKKEANWRRKVEAEKSEVARAKSEAEAIRAKNAELEARLANAKKAPLDFLKASGLSYEDLTLAQLADGKPDANLQVSAVRDEVEGLRKQLAERDAAAEKAGKEKAAAESARAIADFKAGCGDFVKAHAETYELTAMEPNPGELVAEVIAAQWEVDSKKPGFAGKLLTHAEASVKVETFLEEKLRKQQSAKKFQVKAPPQPQAAWKSETSAQSRTLSNDMTVSTPSLSAPNRTEKERIERALAALSK